MYLLDTDVLIDIQRGYAPAVSWFTSLAELPAVPGFVVMELVQDAENAQQVRRALRWACYELEQCIRYKAQDLGMDVLEIDSKHTRQACSRCGYTDRANRRASRFLCKACGYALHADLNAARNIRLRGILTRQVLCQDELPSMSPEVRPDDPASKAGEGTDKPPA